MNDISSKRWIFHPRFKRLEELAKLKLAEKVKALKPRSNFGRKESTYSPKKQIDFGRPSIELPPKKPKRLAVFECVMCTVQWQDMDPGGSVCPTCKSHLYRRRIRYADLEN